MLTRILSNGNTSSFMVWVHTSTNTLDNNLVVSHNFLIFHEGLCTYLENVQDAVLQEENLFFSLMKHQQRVSLFHDLAIHCGQGYELLMLREPEQCEDWCFLVSVDVSLVWLILSLLAHFNIHCLYKRNVLKFLILSFV